MRSTLLILPLIAVLAFPAYAEEKAEPKGNPVLNAVRDFTTDFADADKRHFNTLFSNYNLVQVVKTVRDSVDLAIDKCGEENPDMEEALDTRFKEWKAAVKPVLSEAEGHINNMIHAQEYAKSKDIKKIFKLADDTREEKEKEVNKVPVSTPEACEFLLKTMDETQPNMVEILKSTLISLPKTMSEEDQIAKQKAEEKAQKEAEEKAAKEAEEKAREEAENAEDTAQDDAEKES